MLIKYNNFLLYREEIKKTYEKIICFRTSNLNPYDLISKDSYSKLIFFKPRFSPYITICYKHTSGYNKCLTIYYYHNDVLKLYYNYDYDVNFLKKLPDLLT